MCSVEEIWLLKITEALLSLSSLKHIDVKKCPHCCPAPPFTLTGCPGCPVCLGHLHTQQHVWRGCRLAQWRCVSLTVQQPASADTNQEANCLHVCSNRQPDTLSHVLIFILLPFSLSGVLAASLPDIASDVGASISGLKSAVEALASGESSSVV